MRGLILPLLLLGCEGSAPDETEAQLAAGRAYVEDPAVGRAALEASLVRRDNGYAQLRLENYGEAWAELPEFRPEVAQVEGGPTAVIDTDVEWTDEALTELGREAFFNYPLQLSEALRGAVETPERYGAPRSIVWFEGRVPAFTCATCHTAEREGRVIPGLANGDFDYGRLLTESNGGATEVPWLPGTFDVTGDGEYNPTAVTDLRPIRWQHRLHRAATLNNGLIELAVRVETLLITGRRQAFRPPREIAFALTWYLWGLADSLPEPPAEHPGRVVFEATCAGCHAGEEMAGAEADIELVGTNPAVALSPARGVGAWRIPSLRGVSQRRALLSDGAVRSLADLLDPERETPGHRFGHALPSELRSDLLDFLDHL